MNRFADALIYIDAEDPVQRRVRPENLAAGLIRPPGSHCANVVNEEPAQDCAQDKLRLPSRLPK